ncbi:hypothetical protein D3C75_1272530 [compost metagenome]
MNAQVVTLRLCFHTFGDQRQVELACQFDDAVQYVTGEGVDADHGDKALIDFQEVHIELTQITKA